jgi:hypothetical protein
MHKNMGLDEVLEVEKRIGTDSCSSQSTFSTLTYHAFHYSASQAELLSGSMSGSYNSASLSSAIVSSSYSGSYILVAGGLTNGAILSRALLQFNLQDISCSISTNQIVDPKFYLVLKTCEANEIPQQYTLAAYPISQSWAVGTGYKYDGQVVADGATWKLSDGQTKIWYSGSLSDCSGGGTWWVSASLVGSGSGYADAPYVDPFNPFLDCPSSNYVPPATSSNISVVTGSYVCYQTFDNSSSDVRMDITPIVNSWINGSIVNNGLILMHSDESSSVDYGSLKFFSSNTNTIYSPYIDVAWADALIETGSADPMQIRDAVFSMKNMSKEYVHGSIVRMEVTARKRYPIKTFTNRLSDYLDVYYLPTASYYCIRDAESAEDIIPFDPYTRLSFDANGHYFMLDTTGLPQERYFRVGIKTEQSGSIITTIIPTAFKIVR